MSSKRQNVINDQQELFCREYAKTLSPTKAEKAAGYAPGYSFQLLRKSHIVARIEEIAHAAGEKLGTEQEQILQEAAALAFSDLSDVAGIRSLEDLKDLPLHVRHAVRKIKVKLEYGTIDVVTTEKDIPKRAHEIMIRENVKEAEETRGITGAEIEIQMHDKHQPLRLLALAKNVIGVNQKSPDDPDDEELVYTGSDVYVLSDESK